MKKILSTMLLSISLFGATNELIVPKGDSTIVDIGYKHPQQNYNVNVPKDWVEFDASIRDIDNSIYSVERVLSEKVDCEIDYLGRENCPVQAVDCNANLEQDDGISTRIDKTQIQSKIKKSVPRSQAKNPNEIKGDYRLNPTVGAVDGSRFEIKYESTGLPSPSVMMEDGFVKDGKFALKMFNFGSGCGGMTIYPLPSRIKTIINGGSSVSLKGYSNPCNQTISSGNARYAIVEAVWDTPPTSLSYQCDDFCLVGRPNDPQFGFWNWGCSDTFVDADGIFNENGTCKKDYTYYEYSCKPDTNTYDKPWLGPVIDSGGDCNAQCGPSGCSCNSPTPPANNCVRDNYTCPFDENQLCTITTDEKDSVDNILKGYIYKNGTANTYTKTVEKEKICPNGLEWDKEKDLCEAPLGYTCSNPLFVYDEQTGECLKPLQCDGKVNDDGLCEVEPNHNCPTGYKYDKNSKRCEKAPYCDRGNYNTYSDLCEQEADDSMCNAPYQWNPDRFRCEKDLIEVNPECPGDDLLHNTDTQFCEGWADLSKWTQRGAPSAGNWSYNVANRELYQSINGQPTFYVSTAKYPAAILEGKFKVRNDGDDDWPGIVFGWTGENSFYAFDWKKGNQGAARRGLRLMKMGGTGGNAFGSWGDPNTNNSHEILDSDYGYSGWSYNTWYRLKIQFSSGRIDTFINDVKVLSYQNPNIEIPLGQLGFLNVSQSKVHYKDFYITTVPVCPEGFIYDEQKDVCYEDEASANEDLDLGIVWKNPICTAGFWNEEEKRCKFVSSCTENGILDTEDDKCAVKSVDSCPAEIDYECPMGYFYSQVNNQCEKQPECGTGSNFNYLTSKCEAVPTCQSGWNYNTSSKKCEKLLETVPMVCNGNETHIDTETSDICRVSREINYVDPVGDSCPAGTTSSTFEGSTICKSYDSCPIGYDVSSNINYCDRDIGCPSGYNIDNKNNVCYR